MATTQTKSAHEQTSESKDSTDRNSVAYSAPIYQYIFEQLGYFQGIRPLFIHIAQLEGLTQMKKSALHELIKAGLLPKPIKLSASKNRRAAARWFVPDVVMCLEKLAKSDGGGTALPTPDGFAQASQSRRRSPNEATGRL